MHGRYVVVPDSTDFYKVPEVRPSPILHARSRNDIRTEVLYRREEIWWGDGNRRATVYVLEDEDKDLLLRDAVDSGLLTT